MTTATAQLEALAERSGLRSDERTYIFWPEEPFGIIILGGRRTVQFNNGRLCSTTRQPDGRGLSEDEVQWFVDEANKTEPNPKYIIWPGEMDDAAQMVLMGLLMPRVTQQVLTRAHGADATTMQADITLAMQMMLARDDGLPDIKGFGDPLRIVEKIQPSLAAKLRGAADMVRGNTQMATVAAAIALDQLEIERAAQRAPEELSPQQEEPQEPAPDNTFS